MLLETVLFLNPNREFFFFPKGYYTNIFTKQRGHEHKTSFLWNMKFALCVTFLSSLPLKFFQYSACKNFTAWSLLAYTPCNSSMAVMTKPWSKLLASQPLTVSRCEQFSDPCEDIKLWLTWIFFLFSPQKNKGWLYHLLIYSKMAITEIESYWVAFLSGLHKYTLLLSLFPFLYHLTSFLALCLFLLFYAVHLLYLFRFVEKQEPPHTLCIWFHNYYTVAWRFFFPTLYFSSAQSQDGSAKAYQFSLSTEAKELHYSGRGKRQERTNVSSKM